MNYSSTLSSEYDYDLPSYYTFRSRLEQQPRYYGQDAAVSTRQPTQWGRYPTADHREYAAYAQRLPDLNGVQRRQYTSPPSYVRQMDDYDELDGDQDYDGRRSLSLDIDYDDFMYDLFLNPQYYGHDGAMSHLVPLVEEINVSFRACQERFKNASYLRAMIARNMQEEAQDMHMLTAQMQTLEIQRDAIVRARLGLCKAVAQVANIPARMQAAPPSPEEVIEEVVEEVLPLAPLSIPQRRRPWYRQQLPMAVTKNIMMKKIRKYLDERREKLRREKRRRIM